MIFDIIYNQLTTKLSSKILYHTTNIKSLYFYIMRQKNLI